MTAHRLVVAPDDEPNRALVAAVHPADWVNPEPRGVYNLVVVGAGTAGLVAAAGAAGLGARVALIEQHLMGGDCLNTGCVPSKALIRCARAAAEVRQGHALGVRATGIEIELGAIMQRMRRLRARLAPLDGAARFRDLGVDVFLGTGRFVSRREVEVVPAGAGNPVRLRFARAVIATGARPAVPADIAGLAEAGFLTSDTIFELTALPGRLVVIGGGPVGCELSQCFARLGSRVTLVEAMPGLLGKEEPEAAAIVAARLASEGVTVLTGARVARVEPDRTAVVHTADGQVRVPADAILVAVGRTPRVTGLDLDAAGVAHDAAGVRVDPYLRTSNRRIYAAGDVASSMRFTHAADAMARLVLRNALFFGRHKASELLIPRVTFTDPEIAAVGLTPAQAAAQGVDIATFERRLDEVDRAVLDSATEGLVRVHVRRGTDRIVGATIVAPHAGELIGELVLAMSQGVGLGALSHAIHAYPTTALALRQVADQYNRTRLTPTVARLFRWILALRRR